MVTVSFLPPSSPAAAHPSPRPEGRLSGRCRRSHAVPAIPLALAAVTFAIAVLTAPEQPARQEAICQRHNGVEACRVW
ncbi:MAG: hypothetical protein VKI81_08955 [Synechococcaceae cyanobacterium]|nr:hypothetical protein [Synechococcaceae cyanobacterium]